MDDLLINTSGTLWYQLGHWFNSVIDNPMELVTSANCDYTVSAHPMGCDIMQHVHNYYAMIRDDNSRLLGVINCKDVDIVQNVYAFTVLENLLQSHDIYCETVSTYKSGHLMFGVFRINKTYTILSDNFIHYLIVINDLLKPNGKVTILNVPVKDDNKCAIVYSLGKSIYSLNVPVIEESSQRSYMCSEIMESASSAILRLDQTVSTMAKTLLPQKQIEEFLDLILPYPESTDALDSHDRAYDNVDMKRTFFLTNCLQSDSISQYKGTAYQVYLALVDFIQHYHADGTKAFDLNYKMSLIPGIGVADTKISWAKKFLEFYRKYQK